MAAKKPPAPVEVVYTGGSDGVIIHFPSGPVEFHHGQPVKVSAKDAQSLAQNPDFHPAEQSAPAETPKESS